MKKLLKLSLVLGVLLSLSHSAFADDYANRIVKQKYRKALVVGCENIEVKSPVTAAVLGLLPGGGSFYTGEMGLGIVDALLWPFGSTLWDAPLAWSRAKKQNMEETIYFCELKGKKLK